jgi:hypothetical protein
MVANQHAYFHINYAGVSYMRTHAFSARCSDPSMHASQLCLSVRLYTNPPSSLFIEPDQFLGRIFPTNSTIKILIRSAKIFLLF